MSETIQPKVVKTFLGTIIQGNYFIDTDKLKLFQSDTTPTNDTVVGDLTEADFTGYASVTVTVASWKKGQAPDFREQITDSIMASFAQSGTTITNTVYGWYLTDTAGTQLKAIGRFDSPVLFEHTGVTLFLKVFLLLEMAANYHSEVTT